MLVIFKRIEFSINKVCESVCVLAGFLNNLSECDDNVMNNDKPTAYLLMDYTR